MDPKLIPRIMKFTVLPYALAARAWMDPTFEADLLRHPRAFLLEKSGLFPRDAQYVVLRDTASVKHFVLPWLDEMTRNQSDDALLEILRSECGDEAPFTEFLPAEFILRALRKPDFMTSLINSATSVAMGAGHRVFSDFRVIQNSERVFHLPLRFNHANLHDFTSIYFDLKGDKAVIASSKDCASGTCNNSAKPIP